VHMLRNNQEVVARVFTVKTYNSLCSNVCSDSSVPLRATQQYDYTDVITMGMKSTFNAAMSVNMRKGSAWNLGLHYRWVGKATRWRAMSHLCRPTSHRYLIVSTRAGTWSRCNNYREDYSLTSP